MRSKEFFEKLLSLLKTKTAVRIIAALAAVVVICIIVIIAIPKDGGSDTSGDSFTVVFESNGGSSVASQTVSRGERVEYPEEPTREGYIFGGWYVHGIAWDFDINVVLESTVMRAMWLEAVEVTFDTGEELYTVSVVKNSPIRKSDVPKIERDDFCGWFIGEEQWNFSMPVAEPLTLTAGYYVSLGFTGELPLSVEELYDAIGVIIEESDSGELVLCALGEGDSSGLVNLLEYSEYLPSFMSFLEENSDIYSYLAQAGGIYYAPSIIAKDTYSFYINESLLELLLDSSAESVASLLIDTLLCEPIVTDDEIGVVVSLPDGDTVVTKKLTVAGNILDSMNMYGSFVALYGDEAREQLKSYIDRVYSSNYLSARSSLFVGECAAYDTDELTALLRVAASNPALTGGKADFGIYVDKEDSAALASLISSLFGVDKAWLFMSGLSVTRGAVLYSGNDPDIKSAVAAFNNMIDEGLVTFSEPDRALVRYGKEECRGDYTEILPPVSRRETYELGGETVVIYSSVENSVSCDMGHCLALGELALSDRDVLLAALRVVEYFYSK